MGQLNLREKDVLNILWKSNQDMTSTEIVDEMRGLTQSTVIAVLRKLLKEGYVEVRGVTHSGKVLSRTYRPTEASKEKVLQDFVDTYKTFQHVIPASSLCAEILKIDADAEEVKNEYFQMEEMLMNKPEQ